MYFSKIKLIQSTVNVEKNIYVIKQMRKIVIKIFQMENIKNYENFLFKMKNWIKLFLEKGSSLQ